MLFPRQQIAHAHAGFTRTQPDWAPKKYSAFFERKKEACGRDDGERRQAVSRAGHMLDPPTPPRPHPPKKNLLHPTPPHLLLSPLYQATSLQTSQQPVRPSNLCTQFVKTLCGIWFLGFFVCLILGVLYLSRFLCENWGGLKVIIMLFSYFLLFTIKVFFISRAVLVPFNLFCSQLCREIKWEMLMTFSLLSQRNETRTCSHSDDITELWFFFLLKNDSNRLISSLWAAIVVVSWALINDSMDCCSSSPEPWGDAFTVTTWRLSQ